MSADAVVLDQSLSDESSVPQFVEKQYLYVNDSNNSNYSSQIVIDTTSLSNSGSYLGWSESFLSIPLVLQMKSAGIGAVGAKNVDYAMALKSGYWNLIHSLSVEFNNGSVVQQTPFLNVFTSFKCLTSWSEEDVKQHGKLTGFCPDSADSWLFNDVANAVGNQLGCSGTGVCNNRTSQTISQVLIASGAGSDDQTTLVPVSTESNLSSSSVDCLANKGLMKRLKWLNFSVGADAKSVLLASNPAGLESIFKSYVRSTTNNRAIVFPAIVRMKDVCDFFDKLPLLKGSTMRLYVNTNQAYLQLRSLNTLQSATTGVLGNRGSLALRASPIILGGGGTCPIMVSSNDVGQGFSSIDPTAVGAQARADIEVGLSIVRTQFSQFGADTFVAPVTSVRLYCPAYTMTPQAEAKYLSMMPTKEIVYEDIFQYQIPAVATGAPFNVLVSNGLPNLKSVLVVGHLPLASNGVAVSAGGNYDSTLSSSLLSPFSGTGGCPDPVAITNFNIQISGKNLFNSNKLYDYESFIEQLGQSNQLNGNKTTGLASGLIGEEDFSNLYRYYYADASRGLPSEANVSKSIQIQGTNVSGKSTEYMCFASFTRRIVIDIRSGSRVE
jgi:hypothetical protein